MSLADKSLWITWETQRRNQELAQAFGSVFAHFDYSKSNTVVRYLICIYKTTFLLFTNSSRIVFAQSPSLILGAVLLAIRPFRKMCLVLDAHNITIDNALIGKSVLERLAAYSIRSADYVIVSNTILACEVEKLGGRPLVLADKLPVMHSGSIPDSFAAMKRPHILFVSTYASDEPIELFLEAVVRLEREFTLFVTGKRSKARGLDEKWSSEKIVFTDFLPVVEYDSLLASVDLVVDLSTLANCLVCGAYEAVSAQVPFILSDNEASRACFPKGGLYATNSIEGLEQALNQYFVKAEILRHEVAEMKAEFEARWLREFQSICNTLSKEPS